MSFKRKHDNRGELPVKKVLELRAYITEVRGLYLLTTYYLLEFILISRTCYASSYFPKGTGESSIRHTGSVCRHQSLGAPQSRFHHPVRSRIRCRARICVCSVSRRLAAAAAAASMPVTPQVPLLSSRCVRPL